MTWQLLKKNERRKMDKNLIKNQSLVVRISFLKIKKGITSKFPKKIFYLRSLIRWGGKNSN